MKRKLALLLAGVMTMSMLPMNLFAASSNYTTSTVVPVQGRTVLYENGSTGYSGVSNIAGTNADVVQFAQGEYLVMKPTTSIPTGASMRISLTNAEWAFANKAGTDALTRTGVKYLSAAAITLGSGNVGSMFPDYFNGNSTSYDASSITALTTTASSLGSVADAAVAVGNTTYATANGTYLAATLASPNAIGAGFAGVYFKTEVAAAGEANYPQYVMGVGEGRIMSEAVVYFPTAIPADKEIRIPLVIRTLEDDKDVSATIYNSANGNPIQNGTVTVYSKGTTGTTVATADVVMGRSVIELEPVAIRETVRGTMYGRNASPANSGTFTIAPQDGFEFIYSVAGKTKPEVGFAGFSGNEKYEILSWTKNLITVSVSGLTAAQGQPGVINVLKLVVERKESSYTGDVYVTIENQGLGITNQRVKVAESRQYGLTLTQKASETVPTLVTGRWPSYAGLGDTTRLVTFTLSENTLGSWWTERDLVLNLTDGAKFRRVNISRAENIQFKNAGGSIVSTVDDNSGPIKISGNKLTFVEDRLERQGVDRRMSVEIEAWVSVSQRLADKDITVSVTHANPEDAPTPLVVAKAISPITLAETGISEIKIGLQAQATSDIVITETVAGALLADKWVRITLSDLYGRINDDLVFASDIKVSVPDGNLKIKDVSAGNALNNYANLMNANSSEIRFKVDVKSSKASTIVVSNVMVKATRNIPETNKDYYKVFVYGSAVAENFDVTSQSTGNKATFGLFGTLADAGLYSDYVSIGAGLAGEITNVANEFKFSLAEDATNYSVSGREYPLADDMRGYIKDGTTMVPIRLIAEGFGLNVIWNESNRTVVVDLSTTVKAEFPVGQSYMRIAGAQVDMYDVQGNLVTTEIKNDRTFIPFRQLGYALGIPAANMVWDQATQTVTFNPSTK